MKKKVRRIKNLCRFLPLNNKSKLFGNVCDLQLSEITKWIGIPNTVVQTHYDTLVQIYHRADKLFHPFLKNFTKKTNSWSIIDNFYLSYVKKSKPHQLVVELV